MKKWTKDLNLQAGQVIPVENECHHRHCRQKVLLMYFGENQSYRSSSSDVSGFLVFDCLLFLRAFPVHAVCGVSVVLPLTVSIKTRLAPAITAWLGTDEEFFPMTYWMCLKNKQVQRLKEWLHLREDAWVTLTGAGRSVAHLPCKLRCICGAKVRIFLRRGFIFADQRQTSSNLWKHRITS